MTDKKELNTEAMENVAGGVDVGTLISKGVDIANKLLNGGKDSGGGNSGGGTTVNQTNNNTNSNQQNNVDGNNSQNDVVLQNK